MNRPSSGGSKSLLSDASGVYLRAHASKREPLGGGHEILRFRYLPKQVADVLIRESHEWLRVVRYRIEHEAPRRDLSTVRMARES